MTHVSSIVERFKDAPAFTLRDVRLFLTSDGASKGYPELLLQKLVKKGKAHRISNGVYTFRPEIQTVGFAFQPCYFGLQDALSFRNLWDQETNPVVITPRKVRPGVRTFLGNNYSVHRIDRRMFFGFESIPYGDFWINVSDVEKTLIDMVYFRQPLSKPLIDEFQSKIERKKLVLYLKNTPSSVRNKLIKLDLVQNEK